MPSITSLKTPLTALLVASAALFAVGVAIERSQPAHSAAREAAERAASGTAPAHVESGTEATANEAAVPTTSSAPAGTEATESAANHAEEAAVAARKAATEAAEPAARRAAEAAVAAKKAAAARASAAAAARKAQTDAKESAATHAAENQPATESSATHASEVSSERVFGINPESIVLVIGAVVASLLLALLVWLRPRSRPLLLAVAAASLAFAVFDIREAVHQSGESRTGLTVVAAIVAGLHLAAAVVALWMARAPKPATAGDATAA